MNYLRLLIFLCSSCLIAQQKTYVSEVWIADQGDGTYKNPIIHADYSDPDVVQWGDDYFMTSSSFNAAPGLPILHSKDLVNWELVNYALPKQVPVKHFNTPQHGNGVWAPSIRVHNNELYIYWGDPDFGIYMVKTDDPFGNWEEPVLMMEAKGAIDPSPLWDEDGKAYLVHAWAGSRAGVKSILTVHKMNAEGTKVLDYGRHVFDGHENHPTVEGSKFYKRNGYYYIFAPAGGVSTGWQLVLRSKNIYGPYEEKVVLEQGATAINGPHQGAWVTTDTGEDWFFHFQDVDAYGRIVHLQPMHWKNDWPVMGKDQNGNGIGEPVLQHKKPNVGEQYAIQTPRETDNFEQDSLGLQWQWNANPNVLWSAKLPGNDFLRLYSIAPPEQMNSLWDVPNLLLQKFPAPEFNVATKISLIPGDGKEQRKTGLIIMGRDYAAVTLTEKEGTFYLQNTQAIKADEGAKEEVLEEIALKSNTVYLKVAVSAPDAMCQFSFSENGRNFKKFGTPFKARVGKWIGAKVGLFSISTPEASRGGYADVEYFRITK
ncbi:MULTISPECIES: glycoside hydrolase family 43 protein [Leeuwenhoekiella]|uniref:glycoside hydrolase family 43 protein n=1 Tax=Leeuwenhoekiella TaxID=283735 RepID=UPI000C5F5F53|nr:MULTISPECIES: glycoside hydrolase 43 family protein [Leeuwenhoekiella]MAO44523.1 glycoside hydrolase [Leeuwenhoekiella sp.]|tara:strand:+ start:78409 stop:80031 length:1623 start_codon:yes stop_codon:yes gene_type:complete